MSLLSSIREAPMPAVAIEIAANRIAAATIERRGGRPVVAVHAVEPLPEGALVPSLTASNVQNRTAVATALARVLDRVGRPRRVGLLLPDQVVKVSIVRFEKVPPRTQDLEQLIRWQVRKAAPFPIEEAQVTFVPGIAAADGQDFVVAVARRSIVEEYEALCEEAGAHAGIVDPSTFAVANAVTAGADAPTADWLLVNVAADSASIAILRGPHVIFFRNRAADGDGSLADLVHQSAMYYEDRLQGAGFARVVLSGVASTDVDQARRSLEERLRTHVDTVDPRDAAALTDRIAAAPPLLDALAPLVGLLLRDRGHATNLATRPFYNERAVHAWLLAAAVVMAVATAFNVSRVLRYSHSDTQLATQAAGDEARAADLRRQATRLRATVDQRQLEAKAGQARLANDLIDRRTFSWTELFNRFETTLPDEVRIASVQPHIDKDRNISLRINIVAHGVEDVNRFIGNLEKTGAFAHLLSEEEHPNEKGEYEALLEMDYVPSRAAAGGGATGQP